MLKVVTTLLVMLLDVSQALHLTGRVSQLAKFLSQSDVQVSQTCQAAIQRIKDGPADYKSIIGSGKKYTDTSFAADSEMIRWADRAKSGLGASLKTYVKSTSFSRIRDKFPGAKLFGSEISPFDIYQGRLSDCYWIAATAATANGDPDRIKEIFVTDDYNNEGIFAVNLYIKGKKETITVDDYVPIYNNKPLGNNPYKQDGDWWGAILEKAWAKINNNYESINWGW